MNRCKICIEGRIYRYKSNIFSVYTDKPYNLEYCDNCSLILTSPIPSSDELTNIYNNKYAYDVHLLVEKEKIFRAKKTARYINTLKGIKTVLEIGSMYGFLLKLLEDFQLICTGIELDKKAAEYCISNNLSIINSSLESFLENNNKTYDLVVMSHVLEHIINPEKQLQSLRELINNKGMIIIIVPNSSSLTAKIFGKYWGYWQVPIHITHFNKKSLKYILQASGFKVIDSKTVGGDSLLFLLTIANILNYKSTNLKLTFIRKWIIRSYSAIMKYWYIIGNDDLIVTAMKK